MNYEDMSDFEIELLVSAEKWKERCLSLKMWNNTAKRTYKEIQSGTCVYADARYCSNPSDAFPIIVDSKIAIWPESHGYWQAMRTLKGKNNIRSLNKNPLRAACICFLKMKDAENEI